MFLMGWFIHRLKTSKERIPELEDGTIKTSKTEKKTIKRLGEGGNRPEYLITVGEQKLKDMFKGNT